MLRCPLRCTPAGSHLVSSRARQAAPLASSTLYTPQEKRGMTVTAASTADNDKVLHLMRHGQTEMNVFLRRHYDRNGNHALLPHEDPMMIDTRLTAEGKEQARCKQSEVLELDPRPELVVFSPLSRAIETGQLAFAGLPDVPRTVTPLATEKVWYGADLGRSPSELAKDFPDLDLSDLPEVFWYTGKDGNPSKPVDEPERVFVRRIEQLRDWLAARPEKSIALVAHWGVLKVLSGRSFDNCEIHTTTVSKLAIGDKNGLYI
ncbi:unnamed protein product [Pedinophyceae sp. YPF-701]|nr:unnamed protein product [Pedinophyceae sp. YPF-701]